MQSIFFEIGFIIVLATILGGVAKFLRQPLVLAYILTGFLVKILGFSEVGSPETLNFFSHLGIAFLLFIVGLELNPSELIEMGKKSFVIGLLQVGISFILGFLLSLGLGFSGIEAFFVSIALTFSSTIIIVKLLLEKNDLNSLSGRLTVAILLLQDVVAIFVLIFLSGFSGEGLSLGIFLLTFLKAMIFFVLVYLFSQEILQKIFHFLSSSPELLFLGGVAWCLFLAGIANFAGFSLEIGAFLAGISLASTKYRIEMTTKIKPLRDFFVTIFFVVLGIDLSFSGMGEILLAVFVFTIFVVLIKPLVIMVILGLMGYKKRVAFLTGNALSQISEFSLIISALGLQLNKISQNTASIIVIVAVMTIVFSSYLIEKEDILYKKLKKILSLLPYKAKNHLQEKKEIKYQNHVILIGCHRIGFDLIAVFDKLEIPFVVVDFDPRIIKKLENMSIPFVFGDIGDAEILEEINLKEARMVISTVPNYHDNLAILDEVKRINEKVQIWLTASQMKEALKMYKCGADYVIVPHLLGGHFVANLIGKNWDTLEEMVKVKDRHLGELIKKKEMGYT